MKAEMSDKKSTFTKLPSTDLKIIETKTNPISISQLYQKNSTDLKKIYNEK